MKYLFTLLFIFSSFAFSEDEIDLPYDKTGMFYGDHYFNNLERLLPNKEAPHGNESFRVLFVYHNIDPDCETSRQEMYYIASEAVYASHIHPYRYMTNPTLSVSVECMRRSNNLTVFYITTAFGYRDHKKYTNVIFDSPYNRLGIGDKQFIETAIKESVDEAMADYLKAHTKDPQKFLEEPFFRNPG